MEVQRDSVSFDVSKLRVNGVMVCMGLVCWRTAAILEKVDPSSKWREEERREVWSCVSNGRADMTSLEIFSSCHLKVV